LGIGGGHGADLGFVVGFIAIVLLNDMSLRVIFCIFIFRFLVSGLNLMDIIFHIFDFI
jgi:hypothetical protein